MYSNNFKLKNLSNLQLSLHHSLRLTPPSNTIAFSFSRSNTRKICVATTCNLQTLLCHAKADNVSYYLSLHEVLQAAHAEPLKEATAKGIQVIHWELCTLHSPLLEHWL